jgi:hypothetical protein
LPCLPRSRPRVVALRLPADEGGRNAPPTTRRLFFLPFLFTQGLYFLTINKKSYIIY